jgi:CBS domain-containing protein
MLESVTIKDYATASPVILTENMPVMQAIHELVKHRISGAPVLDLHGNLVGMISQKDCLQIALSSSYHGETAGSVADYMNRDVQRLDADNTILEAIEIFVRQGYQRIPVMDENRLIGMISQHDALRALKTLRG